MKWAFILALIIVLGSVKADVDLSTASDQNVSGSTKIISTVGSVTTIIGDRNNVTFSPTIELSRRTFEDANLTILWNDNVPSLGNTNVLIEDKVVKYKRNSYELWFYQLPYGSNPEDGGFEFMAVLNSKPTKNTIDFKYIASNVNIIQNTYDLPDIKNITNFDLKLLGSISFQYSKQEKGRLGSPTQITQIYRPYITDSIGRFTWANLTLSAGKITIVMPQKFLDTATYPIYIDPTFGYTTMGSDTSSSGSPANVRINVNSTYQYFNAKCGSTISTFSVRVRRNANVLGLNYTLYEVNGSGYPQSIVNMTSAYVNLTGSAYSCVNYNTNNLYFLLTRGKNYTIAAGNFSNASEDAYVWCGTNTAGYIGSEAKYQATFPSTWSRNAEYAYQPSWYANYLDQSQVTSDCTFGENSTVDYTSPILANETVTSNKSILMNFTANYLNVLDSNVSSLLYFLLYWGTSSQYTRVYYDNVLTALYNFNNVSDIGDSLSSAKDLSYENSPYSTQATMNSGNFNYTEGISGLGIYINRTRYTSLPVTRINSSTASTHTIGFWVKTITDTTKNSTLVTFSQGGVGRTDLAFVTNGSTSCFGFTGGGLSKNYTAIYGFPTSEFPNNTWAQITVKLVKNNSTKLSKIYLNAEEKALTDCIGTTGTDARIATPVIFGDVDITNSTEAFFDELLYYDANRTDDEIRLMAFSFITRLNQSNWIFQMNKTNLEVGTYTYSGRIAITETPYTNRTPEKWVQIIDESEPSFTPAFNVTITAPTNGSSYTYPYNFTYNFTAIGNASTYDIKYRLDSNANVTYGNVANNTNIFHSLGNLSAGTHSLVVYATNGTVTNTSNNITFTINRTSMPIYQLLNGAWQNLTITYPTSSNVSGYKNIAEGTLTLYRNGTSYSIPNIETLGIGVYNYTLYFAQTENYTTNSTSLFVTVNQNTTWGLSITVTPATTVTFGTATNTTGIGCPTGLTCTLYRNGTTVSNSDVQTLGVGSYNYTYYFAGNANYSTKTAQQTVVVNQYTQFCNATIDGVWQNKTITYGTSATMNGSSSNVSGLLYRNGTSVSYPQTITSGGGVWNYTFYSAGNANFTSCTESVFLTVNKATPSLSVTLAPSDTVTYPTTTTATGVGCTAPLSCTLYRDITTVASPDVNIYDVGAYNYIYNTTGNENYSSASGSNLLTVNKNNTWWLNITVTPSATVTFGTQTTTTGIRCPAELTCTLYREGIVYANPNIATLGVGTYNYTYYSAGNGNYGPATSQQTVTVGQASQSCAMYIDGADADKTVAFPTSTNATGYASAVAGTLTRNGTGVANPEIGSIPIGDWNYTYYSAGNANYTACTDTNYLHVSSGDTTPPFINITSPLNQTYSQCEYQITLTATANETVIAWWYQLNNLGVNNSFTPPIAITVLNGSNYVQVWANDSLGNIGYNETYFTLNQSCPIIGNATGGANYYFIIQNTNSIDDFWKYLILVSLLLSGGVLLRTKEGHPQSP